MLHLRRIVQGEVIQVERRQLSCEAFRKKVHRPQACVSRLPTQSLILCDQAREDSRRQFGGARESLRVEQLLKETAMPRRIAVEAAADAGDCQA
jgi:hypothetical protein